MGAYIPVIAGANGAFGRLGLTEGEHSGCFFVSSEGEYGIPTSGITVSTDKKPTELDFNASLSTNVYNSSTTVQPKSLAIQYLIKY